MWRFHREKRCQRTFQNELRRRKFRWHSVPDLLWIVTSFWRMLTHPWSYVNDHIWKRSWSRDVDVHFQWTIIYLILDVNVLIHVFFLPRIITCTKYIYISLCARLSVVKTAVWSIYRHNIVLPLTLTLTEQWIADTRAKNPMPLVLSCKLWSRWWSVTFYRKSSTYLNVWRQNLGIERHIWKQHISTRPTSKFRYLNFKVFEF